MAPSAPSDGPYYAPGWSAPRPPTEPLAVGAVVTGALLLGPVPVVLGVTALRRIRTQRTRGAGLAWTGIALGVVMCLTVVAAVVASSLAARAVEALPADVSSVRTAHARQLVTGNCLRELPADGDVDRVTVVPCADPHAAQVITAYAFDTDEPWPGQAAADAVVARSCALSQEELDAGVHALTWSPTQASWSRGDRTGLCLAVTPGGTTTGSMLDGTGSQTSPEQP